MAKIALMFVIVMGMMGWFLLWWALHGMDLERVRKNRMPRDGTGPYGRGFGPGRGRKNGSGLR